MSSSKRQKLGSRRNLPKHRNRNNEEKEDGDELPQVSNKEDENKNPFQSVQPTAACGNQETSAPEFPAQLHSQDLTDLSSQTETKKKRKVGSSRKSTRGFKAEAISNEEPEHRVEVSERISKEVEVIKELPGEEDQRDNDYDQHQGVSDYSSSQILKAEGPTLGCEQFSFGGIMHREAAPDIEATFKSLSALDQSQVAENDLSGFTIVTPTVSKLPQQFDDLLQRCILTKTLTDHVNSLPNTTHQIMSSTQTLLQENRDKSYETECISKTHENMDLCGERSASPASTCHYSEDVPVLQETNNVRLSQLGHTVLNTMYNQSTLNVIDEDVLEQQYKTVSYEERFFSSWNKIKTLKDELEQGTLQNVSTKAKSEDEGIVTHFSEHSNQTSEAESINSTEHREYNKGYKEVCLTENRTDAEVSEDILEAACLKPSLEKVPSNERGGFVRIDTPCSTLLVAVHQPDTVVLDEGSIDKEESNFHYKVQCLVEETENLMNLCDSSAFSNIVKMDSNTALAGNETVELFEGQICVLESSDINTDHRKSYDISSGESEVRDNNEEVLQTTDHIFDAQKYDQLSLAKGLQRSGQHSVEDVNIESPRCQEREESKGFLGLSYLTGEEEEVTEDNAGLTTHNYDIQTYGDACKDEAIPDLPETKFKMNSQPGQTEITVLECADKTTDPQKHLPYDISSGVSEIRDNTEDILQITDYIIDPNEDAQLSMDEGQQRNDTHLETDESYESYKCQEKGEAEACLSLSSLAGEEEVTVDDVGLTRQKDDIQTYGGASENDGTQDLLETMHKVEDSVEVTNSTLYPADIFPSEVECVVTNATSFSRERENEVGTVSNQCWYDTKMDSSCSILREKQGNITDNVEKYAEVSNTEILNDIGGSAAMLVNEENKGTTEIYEEEDGCVSKEGDTDFNKVMCGLIGTELTLSEVNVPQIYTQRLKVQDNSGIVEEIVVNTEESVVGGEMSHESISSKYSPQHKSNANSKLFKLPQQTGELTEKESKETEQYITFDTKEEATTEGLIAESSKLLKHSGLSSQNAQQCLPTDIQPPHGTETTYSNDTEGKSIENLEIICEELQEQRPFKKKQKFESSQRHQETQHDNDERSSSEIVYQAAMAESTAESQTDLSELPSDIVQPTLTAEGKEVIKSTDEMESCTWNRAPPAILPVAAVHQFDTVVIDEESREKEEIFSNNGCKGFVGEMESSINLSDTSALPNMVEVEPGDIALVGDETPGLLKGKIYTLETTDMSIDRHLSYDNLFGESEVRDNMTQNTDHIIDQHKYDQLSFVVGLQKSDLQSEDDDLCDESHRCQEKEQPASFFDLSSLIGKVEVTKDDTGLSTKDNHIQTYGDACNNEATPDLPQTKFKMEKWVEVTSVLLMNSVLDSTDVLPTEFEITATNNTCIFQAQENKVHTVSSQDWEMITVDSSCNILREDVEHMCDEKYAETGNMHTSQELEEPDAQCVTERNEKIAEKYIEDRALRKDRASEINKKMGEMIEEGLSLSEVTVFPIPSEIFKVQDNSDIVETVVGEWGEISSDSISSEVSFQNISDPKSDLFIQSLTKDKLTEKEIKDSQEAENDQDEKCSTEIVFQAAVTDLCTESPSSVNEVPNNMYRLPLVPEEIEMIKSNDEIENQVRISTPPAILPLETVVLDWGSREKENEIPDNSSQELVEEAEPSLMETSDINPVHRKYLSNDNLSDKSDNRANNEVTVNITNSDEDTQVSLTEELEINDTHFEEDVSFESYRGQERGNSETFVALSSLPADKEVIENNAGLTRQKYDIQSYGDASKHNVSPDLPEIKFKIENSVEVTPAFVTNAALDLTDDLPREVKCVVANDSSFSQAGEKMVHTDSSNELEVIKMDSSCNILREDEQHNVVEKHVETKNTQILQEIDAPAKLFATEENDEMTDVHNEDDGDLWKHESKKMGEMVGTEPKLSQMTVSQISYEIFKVQDNSETIVDTEVNQEMSVMGREISSGTISSENAPKSELFKISHTKEKLTETEIQEGTNSDNPEDSTLEDFIAAPSKQYIQSVLASQTVQSLTTDTQPLQETETTDSKETEGKSNDNLGLISVELKEQSLFKKKKKFGSTRRFQGGHQSSAVGEESELNNVEATEETENKHANYKRCPTGTVYQTAITDSHAELQNNVSVAPFNTFTVPLTSEAEELIKSNDEMGSCVRTNTSHAKLPDAVHRIYPVVIDEGTTEKEEDIADDRSQRFVEQPEPSVNLCDTSASSNMEEMAAGDTAIAGDETAELLKEKMCVLESTNINTDHKKRLTYDKLSSEVRVNTEDVLQITDQIFDSYKCSQLSLAKEQQTNYTNFEENANNESYRSQEREEPETCVNISSLAGEEEVTKDVAGLTRENYDIQTYGDACKDETIPFPSEAKLRMENSVEVVNSTPDSADVLPTEVECVLVNTTSFSQKSENEICTISEQHWDDAKMASSCSVPRQEGGSMMDNSGKYAKTEMTQISHEIVSDALFVREENDKIADVLGKDDGSSRKEGDTEMCGLKSTEPPLSKVAVPQMHCEVFKIQDNTEILVETVADKEESVVGREMSSESMCSDDAFQNVCDLKSHLFNIRHTKDKHTEKDNKEIHEKKPQAPEESTMKDLIAESSKQLMHSGLSSQTDQQRLTTDTQPSQTTVITDFKDTEGKSKENLGMICVEAKEQTLLKKPRKFGSTRRHQGGHQELENTRKTKNDQDEKCSAEIMYHAALTDSCAESQSFVSEVPLNMVKLPLTTEGKEMIKSNEEMRRLSAPLTILPLAVHHTDTMVLDDGSRKKENDIPDNRSQKLVEETEYSPNLCDSSSLFNKVEVETKDSALTKDETTELFKEKICVPENSDINPDQRKYLSNDNVFDKSDNRANTEVNINSDEDTQVSLTEELETNDIHVKEDVSFESYRGQERGNSETFVALSSLPADKEVTEDDAGLTRQKYDIQSYGDASKHNVTLDPPETMFCMEDSVEVAPASVANSALDLTNDLPREVKCVVTNDSSFSQAGEKMVHTDSSNEWEVIKMCSSCNILREKGEYMSDGAEKCAETENTQISQEFEASTALFVIDENEEIADVHKEEARGLKKDWDTEINESMSGVVGTEPSEMIFSEVLKAQANSKMIVTVTNLESSEIGREMSSKSVLSEDSLLNTSDPKSELFQLPNGKEKLTEEELIDIQKNVTLYTQEDSTTEHFVQASCKQFTPSGLHLSADTQPSQGTEITDYKDTEANNNENQEQNEFKKKRKFGSTRRFQGHKAKIIDEENEFKDLTATEESENDNHEKVTTKQKEIKDSEDEIGRCIKIDTPPAILPDDDHQTEPASLIEVIRVERLVDITDGKSALPGESEYESLCSKKETMQPIIQTYPDVSFADAFTQEVYIAKEQNMKSAENTSTVPAFPTCQTPDFFSEQNILAKSINRENTLEVEHVESQSMEVSEPEKAESACPANHTEKSKLSKESVIKDNSQLMSSGKRRKMGSTRKSHRGQLAGVDQREITEEIKETEHTTEQISEEHTGNTKECHLETTSQGYITALHAEKYYQSTEREEKSLDVMEPNKEKTDKKEGVGSTCKNLKGGERNKTVQEGAEDTHTRPDSKGTTDEKKIATQEDKDGLISGVDDTVHTLHIVESAVQSREQHIYDKPDHTRGSLLSEIESELKKSTQSLGSIKDLTSLNTSLETCDNQRSKSDITEPESDQCKNTLEVPPIQSSQTHNKPNSPVKKRKMGSTRKSSKNKHSEETREDENKTDQYKKENLEKQGEFEGEIAPEIKIDPGMVKIEEDIQRTVNQTVFAVEEMNIKDRVQHSPGARRKFGSRRIAKDSKSLGVLTAAEDDVKQSPKEDEKVFTEDLKGCDPYFICDPKSAVVPQTVLEPGSMESSPGNVGNVKPTVNKSDVSSGTVLVSLDDIRQAALHDGKREKLDFEKWSKQNFEVAVYNVVMVGNSNVGKTSFIQRFQSGEFSPDYSSTIGIDTCVQTITLDNRTVKLHIWDTAGQERYHSITKQVFHKAQGLLLMYDITSSQSFTAIRDWVCQIEEAAPADVIMMLLGNKKDCTKREVQFHQGEALSREYNIHFMECSAATGENVTESMKTLAWLLLKQKVRREEKQTILQEKQPQKKSGCC